MKLACHLYAKVKPAGLTRRIKEVAKTRVRYGYRRIHVLLRREGWTVNATRNYRLYKKLGLQCVTKGEAASQSGPGGAGDIVCVPGFGLWTYQRGVMLDFSRPGKPTDNAFKERLKSKFRAECRNRHLSAAWTRLVR